MFHDCRLPFPVEFQVFDLGVSAFRSAGLLELLVLGGPSLASPKMPAIFLWNIEKSLG